MRRWSVPLLFLALLVASASLGTGCARTPPARVEVRLQGPHGAQWEMGPAQQEANALLSELNDLLDANRDDAARAVQRVDAFVDLNRDRMVANVQQLEAYAAGLSAEELEIYDAQYMLYLEHERTRWHELSRAYARQDATQWRRIERIVSSVSR